MQQEYDPRPRPTPRPKVPMEEIKSVLDFGIEEEYGIVKLAHIEMTKEILRYVTIPESDKSREKQAHNSMIKYFMLLYAHDGIYEKLSWYTTNVSKKLRDIYLDEDHQYYRLFERIVSKWLTDDYIINFITDTAEYLEILILTRNIATLLCKYNMLSIRDVIVSKMTQLHEKLGNEEFSLDECVKLIVFYLENRILERYHRKIENIINRIQKKIKSSSSSSEESEDSVKYSAITYSAYLDSSINAKIIAKCKEIILDINKKYGMKFLESLEYLLMKMDNCYKELSRLDLPIPDPILSKDGQE